jgi:hypothetical protein
MGRFQFPTVKRRVLQKENPLHCWCTWGLTVGLLHELPNQCTAGSVAPPMFMLNLQIKKEKRKKKKEKKEKKRRREKERITHLNDIILSPTQYF